MAEKALIGSASTAVVTTASTTWYGALGATGALTGLSTTEAPVQIACRTPGTFRNLRVNFGTNSRTTNTVVTLRVNGADTALTVSSGTAGPAIVTNTTTDISVSAGDLISYSVTTGTGTGNIEVSTVAIEVESTGQAASQVAATGSSTFSAARFFQPFGTIVASSTEAAVLSQALESVTLSNMQAYVSANASTGFTIVSRKNGANGAQTISVGSGATGLFEDTTNTDSLALNDTFAISVSNPGANVTLTTVAMKVTGANDNRVMVGGGAAPTNLAAGNVRYMAWWGPPVIAVAESRVQVSMPFAASISQLCVRVTSNASTTDVTIDLMVNGVATAQTITIPASGGSNIFYVSAGVPVSVAVGDLVAIRAQGATTGAVAFSGMSALVDGVSAPAAGGVSTSLSLMGVGG